MRKLFYIFLILLPFFAQGQTIKPSGGVSELDSFLGGLTAGRFFRLPSSSPYGWNTRLDSCGTLTFWKGKDSCIYYNDCKNVYRVLTMRDTLYLRSLVGGLQWSDTSITLATKADVNRRVRYSDSGTIYATPTMLNDTAAVKVSKIKYALDSVNFYLTIKDTASALRIFVQSLPSYGISTTDLSHWNLAYQKYIVSQAFSVLTGILTTTLNDATQIATSLDGRYTKYSDTAVFLQTISATNTALAAVQKYTDTISWDATKANLNAALANVIKYSDSTKYVTPATLNDTANALRIASGGSTATRQFFSDTNTYDATKFYVINAIASKQNYSDTLTYDATIAFVNAALNPKQAYSDTLTWDATKANMNSIVATLVKYADTVGMSNRINQRVKYTDSNIIYVTPVMLNDTAAAIRGEVVKRQYYTDTSVWDATRAWVNALNANNIKYSDTNGIVVTPVMLKDTATAIRVNTNAIAATKQAYADTLTWDATLTDLADSTISIRNTINLNLLSLLQATAPLVYNNGTHNFSLTTGYGITTASNALVVDTTNVSTHAYGQSNFWSKSLNSFGVGGNSAFGTADHSNIAIYTKGRLVGMIDTSGQLYFNTSTNLGYVAHFGGAVGVNTLRGVSNPAHTLDFSNANYVKIENGIAINVGSGVNSFCVSPYTSTPTFTSADTVRGNSIFNLYNRTIIGPAVFTYLDDNTNPYTHWQFKSEYYSDTNANAGSADTIISYGYTRRDIKTTPQRQKLNYVWRATSHLGATGAPTLLTYCDGLGNVYFRDTLYIHPPQSPNLTTDSTIVYNSACNCLLVGNPVGTGTGGGTTWGSITGTLSSQTDLQTALNAKVPFNDTVGGAGSYPNYLTISYLRNWTGSANITTLGTITTGVWNGTAIANANLANSTISGQALGTNLPSLTITSPLTGASYNGTAGVTLGLAGLTGLGTANQVLGMNNAATGYEYKTLVAGTNITITHAANSITINATGSGGGTPGTPTGSIQWNNGGAFAGLSNVNGSADGYEMLTGQTTGAVISSSTANQAKIFNRVLAGYNMLCMIDTITGEIIYQPHSGMKNIGHFWGPASFGDGIWNAFNGGSSSNSTPSFSTTNLASDVTVRNFSTTSTAGTSNGMYMCGAYQGFYVGSTWKGGGMLYIARFTLPAYASTQRFFVGFTTSSCAQLTNADQSGVNNTIGINKDIADATFQFLSKGSGTATKTNTTLTPNQNDLYCAIIFVPSKSTTVYEAIIHYTTTGWDLHSFSEATNIPAAGTFMYPTFWVNNGSTAAVRTAGVSTLYTETDY